MEINPVIKLDVYFADTISDQPFKSISPQLQISYFL